MPDYIFDPLEDSDPDLLQQAAFDFLQARWPQWTPDEGNLETWLIAALARMVSEARDVAADVPPAIFKYLGTNIAGVPPITATSATVGSTWTFIDNPAGRAIEAGTLIGIEDDQGELFSFEVQTTKDYAAGILTTSAGDIVLIATEEGAGSTGLGGIGALGVNVEGITWVDTITLTGVSAGGADEEDDQDYLNRLSARMTLYPPPPVVPSHFQLLAIDIAARNGIRARVTAIDGYNPIDLTSNNEKMIALAGIDADTGDNLSAPLKTTIDAELQSLREINFVVNMFDPTRTDVDVTFVGVVEPGYDPVAVRTLALAALSDFLDGANWGTIDESGAWANHPIVRHQDVSTVLNNIVGFSHWTTLTIGLAGGVQAATDKTLTGVAPLPNPGALNGTMS